MNGALSDPQPLAARRTDLHQREGQSFRVPCQQRSIGVGQELPLAGDSLPDDETRTDAGKRRQKRDGECDHQQASPSPIRIYAVVNEKRGRADDTRHA
jgi:hypothetical protein